MAAPTRRLGLSAPRRLAASAVASALPLTLGMAWASATPASAAPAPAHTVPQATAALGWHRCDSHFLCSDVEVPLDYSRPAGARVRLALVELPSTGKHPIGDLVTNPGGPGGSGIEFIEGQGFPPALLSMFNLVSFDPRGIGQSNPVTCVGTAEMRRLAAANPDPVTPSQVATSVQESQAFDRACTQHTSRALLENVNTLDTARDLDLIRAALGQDKLDYMGFSYGTYLGELYAELFPRHIRAMVLDGVVNPALSVSTVAGQQADGFEFDLNAFFAWCPTDKSCRAELPDGAQRSYQQLMGHLTAGGRLIANLRPMYGGTQQVTVGLAATAVLGSLYAQDAWPYLAQAISQGLQGDGSSLAALAYLQDGLQTNGQFSNLAAANTAINCVDRPYPKQISFYQRLAAKLAKTDPNFGAYSAWSDLGCALWPIPAQGQPAPVKIKGAPPILLIGSTGDPATPYPWAREVAKQIPKSRLLTRDGPGHTGYLYSTCVQRWADQYLQTLQLPPRGSVCPSGI